MVVKIIFTVIMAFGLLFPMQFNRVTEFWRFDKEPRGAESCSMTRFLCAIAIAVIWIKPLL